jgi:hypothetical protein
MVTNSEYLYGDSTPAPLKTDFMGYLRDLMDFAVESLVCQGQAGEAIQNAARLGEKIEREIEHAETLAGQLSDALERADLGGADSLVGRCAANIRSEAWNVVRLEAAAARAAVEAESGRATQTAAMARSSCEKALGELLLRQEIPDAIAVVKLNLEGAGYEARLHAQTPYGLSWDLALQIPEGHLLSRVLRLGCLVERLEVETQEDVVRWPNKGAKSRSHRLDRLYLSELVFSPSEALVKLRTAIDGTGGGFDLWMHRGAGVLRLERVHANEATNDPPFDAARDDVDNLLRLHDALGALVSEIARNRRSPVAVRIDDKPVSDCEPYAVVDRLVAHVAPEVEQIARRSLAPGELVLRRRLDENHREEAFLSKADLQKKVESVAPELRIAFAPLNLGEVARPLPDVAMAPIGPVAQIPRATDTAPLPWLEVDPPPVLGTPPSPPSVIVTQLRAAESSRTPSGVRQSFPAVSSALRLVDG